MEFRWRERVGFSSGGGPHDARERQRLGSELIRSHLIFYRFLALGSLLNLLKIK